MEKLDDSILIALGQSAVSFSHLEEELIERTSELINPDNSYVGLIPLANQNIDNVLKILASLIVERTNFPIKHPLAVEIRKKSQETLAIIHEAKGQRNRYLHSFWSPVYDFDYSTEEEIHNPFSVELKKRSRGVPFSIDSESIKIDDVLKLSQAIDSALVSFRDFVKWTRSLEPDLCTRQGSRAVVPFG